MLRGWWQLAFSSVPVTQQKRVYPFLWFGVLGRPSVVTLRPPPRSTRAAQVHWCSGCPSRAVGMVPTDSHTL